MMRSLMQALRQLTGTPTFTAPFVLSVALGIGATTAMFTFVNALLLKALPVENAGRLISVASLDSRGHDAGVPLPLLERLRVDSGLGGVCGFLTPLSALETQGSVSARSSLAVSADCFETFGVRPAIGRLLGREDDAPGAPAAAVLSYEAWMRDFGGRAEVIGQEVAIDGLPTTIVGVTEQRFRGLLLGFPAHVVYPLRAFQERLAAERPLLSAAVPVTVFARLAGGESIEQTRARLRTMWPRLLELSLPAGYEGPTRQAYLNRQLSVTSAATGVDYALRQRFSSPALALLALSVLLLLISCVNVVNLMLLRGVARRTAVALRVALGAGRWTLIRGDLAELGLSLLLGVAMGLALAYVAARLLLSLLSSMYVGLDITVAPDVHTLVFAAVVAGVLGVSVVSLSALTATWADPRGLLAGGVTRVVGGGSRLRGALVSLQVALAVALVSLAAVFATSLGQLRTAPVGFEPQHVVGAPLLSLSGGPQARMATAASYRELLDDVSHLPGVLGVALTRSAPFSRQPPTGTISMNGLHAERAELNVVTENFFATIGVPILSGRSFRHTESTSDTRIEAIISESMARALAPSRDAAGLEVQVVLGQKVYDARIVGVARDAYTGNARERNPRVGYLNLWQTQEISNTPVLLLRTEGDSGAVVSAVRRTLHQRGREYPARIRTLLAERDAALAQEHLLASAAGMFALVGLLVAAVGLYGILNFSVASRREELGLRMALGAARARVVGLVVGHAIKLILGGVALGLPLAYLGIHSVRALVPAVDAFELAPISIVVGSLAGIGLLASWVPAWRAARISPLEALRGR